MRPHRRFPAFSFLLLVTMLAGFISSPADMAAQASPLGNRTAGELRGTDRYVSPTGANQILTLPDGFIDNDCTSTPCLTVDWAHDQAVAGDAIHIDCGTYDELALRFEKDISIFGPDGEPCVVLTDTLPDRVLTILSDLEINISNVEVSGATFFDDGAGISVGDRSSLALTNVIVANNTSNGASATGGGIYLRNSATLTLTNSIVQNNHTEGEGGAIYTLGGSTVTIQGSQVLSNTAGSVGGLYSQGNTHIFGASEFAYNQAVGVAALYSEMGGDMMIEDTTFHANTATLDTESLATVIHSGGTFSMLSAEIVDNAAGGLVTEGFATIHASTFRNNVSNAINGAIANLGNLSINETTIYQNQSLGLGGGIANGGDLVVNRSSIYENEAQLGGGISIGPGSSTTVSNSTIHANSATRGGAIDYTPAIFPSPNASLTLNNVTMTANSASGDGGGMYFGDLDELDVDIFNSVIANNTGDDCSEPISATAIPSLDSDGTCGVSLTADPLLGMLQNNGGLTPTRMPQSDSPLIGAAADVICDVPPVDGVDQRGVERDDDCDLGAVERGASVPTAIVLRDASGGLERVGIPSGGLFLLLIVMSASTYQVTTRACRVSH